MFSAGSSEGRRFREAFINEPNLAAMVARRAGYNASAYRPRRLGVYERSKVNIRGPRSLSGYASDQRRNAMSKSEVLRGARRKRRPAGRVELPGALEGQIEEICRDCRCM